MSASVTKELVSLLDYAHARLLGRLAGLGDEEYRWEPVPGCWSVRPGPDGVFRADHVVFPAPAPNPAPFTTIAWRVWHIGAECLHGYSVRFFGDPLDPDFDDARWPGTATEGVARLDGAWSRVRGQIAAMDDEALAQPMGSTAGPFADDTFHALVLHVLDEVIHHGGEIGVVRDLYRATAGRALP
ncbi:MAG TPA: DinB family protein [Actinocrinis sp.]|nr:DinB family protein [Actinocrinis sp.]